MDGANFASFASVDGARERTRVRHFRAGIDGIRVHFVHERARSGRGIPLILTNGWPSCFAEFLPLVPRLTDPAAHGIDGPGFDVVIPSLPGYGFSDRPARTGVTCRYTAGLWHRLMRGLGYQRYGAHGGDFGSAEHHPDGKVDPLGAGSHIEADLQSAIVAARAEHPGPHAGELERLAPTRVREAYRR